MKWSEQMRELLSEDEHYNQLVYYSNESELYLNNKIIFGNLQSYSLSGIGEINAMFYDDTIEIMKKYPFFTDIKFLLNCIIKENRENGIAYSKPSNIIYQKFAVGTWLLIPTNGRTLGIQIDLKEHDAGSTPEIS